MWLRIAYVVFGIAVGVLFVFWFHDYMAGTTCVSINGQYQPDEAVCIDATGQHHPITVTNYMLFLYIIFGAAFAVMGAYFLRKVVIRVKRRLEKNRES